MVNGLSHKVGRGEFSTTVKLVPVTGFGTYRNYLNQLREASQALIDIETARNNGTGDTTAQSANGAAQQRIGEITSGLCNTTTTSRRNRGAGHTGPGAGAGPAGPAGPAGAGGAGGAGGTGGFATPEARRQFVELFGEDEAVRTEQAAAARATAETEARADAVAVQEFRLDEEVRQRNAEASRRTRQSREDIATARRVQERESGFFGVFATATGVRIEAIRTAREQAALDRVSALDRTSSSEERASSARASSFVEDT